MPAEGLGEHAAHQQADGTATHGHEDVGAHGLGSLDGVGELGDDDGQDHRGGEGGTQSLHEAGADEHPWEVDAPHTADDSGEQRHPGHEHPLPADQVAQSAGQQERATERDQVGVDDP